MEASVARGVAVRAGGEFKPGKNGQEVWLYLKSSEKLLKDFKQSKTEMKRLEEMTPTAIQGVDWSKFKVVMDSTRLVRYFFRVPT